MRVVLFIWLAGVVLSALYLVNDKDTMEELKEIPPEYGMIPLGLKSFLTALILLIQALIWPSWVAGEAKQGIPQWIKIQRQRLRANRHIRKERKRNDQDN